MLNVGSNDDRATPARIRDAAISYVGEHGWDRATSRQIAAEAGVPVGLVNYHFGSKDGLHQACDDWVIERVGEDKGLLLGSGPLPHLDTYLEEHPELRPMSAYIAMSLRHGGPVADHLFESMVTLTRDMLELAADAGTMRRFKDPYAMSVVLVAYGSGASLFGPIIARLLGGTDLLDPDTYLRYGRTTVDLFTQPLFTDDRYLQSLDSHDVPAASAEGELHKEKE
jgi:AcrR family transcriptional regulator